MASLCGILPGIILALSVYIGWGFRLIPENEFWVIERLRQYDRTLLTGWHIMCLPGLVDSIAPNGGRGDFRLHQVIKKLENPNEMIDFTDGSSKVVYEIWYYVISPKAPINDSAGNPIKDGPFRSVYKVKETEDRISQVLTNRMRPLLQRRSIDDASRNLENISKKIRNDPAVKNAMHEMGVDLEQSRGFIISDIDLSDEVKAIRQEKLVGEKEAQRQEAVGAGYGLAIRKIIETASRDGGTKITWTEARQIYEKQRALEAIQKTGAGIHFIAPDLPGILGMLDPQRNQSTPPKKGGRP